MARDHLRCPNHLRYVHKHHKRSMRHPLRWRKYPETAALTDDIPPWHDCLNDVEGVWQVDDGRRCVAIQYLNTVTGWGRECGHNQAYFRTLIGSAVSMMVSVSVFRDRNCSTLFHRRSRKMRSQRILMYGSTARVPQGKLSCAKAITLQRSEYADRISRANFEDRSTWLIRRWQPESKGRSVLQMAKTRL